MGDYPTLNDLNTAYGNGFSADWLLPQLFDLSSHTGARNLTEKQQESLARIIAIEYRHLKVTEILLFFHRFKAGYYGRFYGSVDPMVITCALRDFLTERGDMINHYLQLQREQQQEEELRNNPPVSREEWLRMKQSQHNPT